MNKEKEEAALEGGHKEKVDYLGKHEGFQGKAREQWHPFDRKSGTGRGKELAKGGWGKGNWGDAKDEIIQAEEALAGKEAPSVVLPEPNWENQDFEGLTLSEYQARHGKSAAQAASLPARKEDELLGFNTNESGQDTKQGSVEQKSKLDFNEKEFPVLK